MDATLIKKSCGHYGIVRAVFEHERIACSQCELAGNVGEVMIVARRIVASDTVPENRDVELMRWIVEMLESKR